MVEKKKPETPPSFLKNCVACRQQIPIASDLCPFCNTDQKTGILGLILPSKPIESQDSSKAQKSVFLKPEQNARNILAALLIVCIIGLPVVYSLGYINGTNSAGFDFYYVKPKQRYGVDELDNYLKQWEWVSPYQENAFDCSEMSAFVERDLENQGFHTTIVVGNSPFGSGRHVWLLVETTVGKYVPVEATEIEVVWRSSPYFDNYFKYDHEFETIEDALEYSQTDFDWWNS